MPVPSTGTFKVYPYSIATVDSNGFTWSNNPGHNYLVDKDNQGFVDMLNAGGNPSATTISDVPMGWPFHENGSDGEVPFAALYEMEMFPDTSNIVFNPGTVDEQIVDILSGDFPAGFSATNIKVRILFYTAPTSGVTNYCNFLKLLYFGGVIKTVNNPNQGPLLGPPVWYESDADAIVPTGTYFNAAQTFKKFGFQVDFDDAGLGISNNFCSIFVVEMTGDYITDSSQVVTATPTSNLNAGDEITITDPQERLLDTKVVYLQSVIDGETVRIPCPIILMSSGTLVIRLSRGPVNGDTLVIVIEGITFDGEINAAVLSAELADGSGIYKLVPEQKYDIYYDRTDPLAPTEVNMAIPTPFIRTGFF